MCLLQTRMFCKPRAPSPPLDAAPSLAVDDHTCQGECQSHQEQHRHQHAHWEAPGRCGAHKARCQQGSGGWEGVQGPFWGPISAAKCPSEDHSPVGPSRITAPRPYPRPVWPGCQGLQVPIFNDVPTGTHDFLLTVQVVLLDPVRLCSVKAPWTVGPYLCACRPAALHSGVGSSPGRSGTSPCGCIPEGQQGVRKGLPDHPHAAAPGVHTSVTRPSLGLQGLCHDP